MTRIPMASAAGLTACLALAAGVAGCRVHVDKDASGKDKNVQVDTPFGGVHVNSDQTTASDLGLPAYPGAQIVGDKENDKSADVRLGFGDWQMRVEVVNYMTADSQEKVQSFYKQALGRYGDVLTCQDNAPVGTPTHTAEGLTCAGDGQHHGVKVDTDSYTSGNGGLELKAGSERHQHIVGFKASAAGQTRFVLVALDLPRGDAPGTGKSN